jgi:arylsulfatase A-like enzyme
MSNCGDYDSKTPMMALHRLAATVLICLMLAHAGTAGERPNIVLIMTDDHAYQAISAYGSILNNTPHIDRLAAEGMRLDRCYVTDSICSPSRATILTGKYGHLHGVRDNYTRFDGSQPTFPKLLQAAGYQTALIGKWHLQSDPTGFDYWDILPGQGKYYRPDFRCPKGVRKVSGYVTDRITQFADEWLRKRRDPDKPFLLMVHHKAPHRPWDPGIDHLGDFADAPLPEPSTLRDDHRGQGTAARVAEMRITQMRPSPDLKVWKTDDPHRKWLYDHMTPQERAAWEKTIDPRWEEFGDDRLSGDERLGWMYRHYLEDYLGCVASVDEGVGTLLDSLHELGLEENTVVVYTSDQGFYLGEHGWFDKRFMYEQSLRTPLLVRWPGVIAPGSTEDRIVSNVDFAPTLLDAAGESVPADMQGESLLPLWKGENPPKWRQSFYYNYHEGVHRDHKVSRHEGVTTGRHKLIHFFPLAEWELYDLQADPEELHSVYGLPRYAHLQGELTAELERLRRELGMPLPTPE